MSDVPAPVNVFGLEIAELPQGWTPLEAIVIVTCLNEEGETTAVIRSTEGMMPWEMLGLVEVAKHEWLTDEHNRWSDE